MFFWGCCVLTGFGARIRSTHSHTGCSDVGIWEETVYPTAEPKQPKQPSSHIPCTFPALSKKSVSKAESCGPAFAWHARSLWFCPQDPERTTQRQNALAGEWAVMAIWVTRAFC